MTTRLEFSGQPDLPNNRVQGGWFSLLSHIMTARSLVEVRATYNQAQGYIAALADASVIDAIGATRMATTALCALNEALEALHIDGKSDNDERELPPVQIR